MNLKNITIQGNRKCPKCKKTKSIMEGFGLRIMDKKTGKIRNQSWCKKCR